jgi:hypothetical protein
MKLSFRLIAVWLMVTGVLMGVSFGVGLARGKGSPAQSSTTLTPQQVQQILGGSTGGGQTPQQGQGPQQILVGPGPGGPPGAGG